MKKGIKLLFIALLAIMPLQVKPGILSALSFAASSVGSFMSYTGQACSAVTEFAGLSGYMPTSNVLEDQPSKPNVGVQKNTKSLKVTPDANVSKDDKSIGNAALSIVAPIGGVYNLCCCADLFIWSPLKCLSNYCFGFPGATTAVAAAKIGVLGSVSQSLATIALSRLLLEAGYNCVPDRMREECANYIPGCIKNRYEQLKKQRLLKLTMLTSYVMYNLWNSDMLGALD